MLAQVAIFHVFVQIQVEGASLRNVRKRRSAPETMPDDNRLHTDWGSPLVQRMRDLENSIHFTAEGKDLPAANVKLPWGNQVVKYMASGGAELKDLFSKIDYNQDGSLSVEEISVANPMDRDRTCNAETAVMCADKDDSGSISEEEFEDQKGIQTCFTNNAPLCHGTGNTSDYQAVILDHDHGMMVIWSKELRIYQLVNSSLTQKIRMDFVKADKDSNGYLSPYEMADLTPIKNNSNPSCTGAIMLRCADEDADGKLDLIEYADMFNTDGFVDDFKTCMATNQAQCNVTKTPSWNASGIPKVSYSPALCRQMFAYRHTRDLCLRLQPEVCGKDCSKFGENGTDECDSFQKAMCQLPQHTSQGEPLAMSVASPPKGKKASVATVCIAVSNWGPNELWLAREENKSFIPLATRLAYMDCVQVKTFQGESFFLYTGARQVMSWTSGKRNELILVGRAEAGLTKAKLTRFSFKDEDMLRPILCQTAPNYASLEVNVQGKQWHPFNEVDQAINYLQCEVLLLDHDDSMREQESLQLVKGDYIELVMPVSPVQSLFLVTETENGSLSYRAHNLGFLKY
jgi:Ca2+-binding EF-hand superfamily protein